MDLGGPELGVVKKECGLRCGLFLERDGSRLGRLLLAGLWCDGEGVDLAAGGVSA